MIVILYILGIVLSILGISWLGFVVWTRRYMKTTFSIAYVEEPEPIKQVRLRRGTCLASVYPKDKDDNKHYTGYILSGNLFLENGDLVQEGTNIFFETVTPKTNFLDSINNKKKLVLLKTRKGDCVVRPSLLYIQRGTKDEELKKLILEYLPIDNDDVAKTMTRIRLLEKDGADLVVITGTPDTPSSEYFHFTKLYDILGLF